VDRLDPIKDGASKDILDENIQKLKKVFPEIVTEDKIDFEKLKETLGEYVEDREERYNFTWNGKSEARRLAQTLSTGTLRPCPGESVNWEKTENLFIEGDNLEVLKLLQKSYHKKVKMIYIDPPYNTGSQFIYPDDFKDNIKNYLQLTGQIDEEDRKLSVNPETSGRYHTDWLNMMYPRLKLARNLLRDDGVIFISIDDNEVSNLRKMCDEIFGEDNFIADIIWQKKYRPQNDAVNFSDNHDYIVSIAKIKKQKRTDNGWNRNLLPRSQKSMEVYSNPDNDPRGPWQSSGLMIEGETPNCIYDIVGLTGRLFKPDTGKRWSVSKSTFDQLLEENRIWFGRTGDATPRVKRYLSEVQDGVVPSTIFLFGDVGHTGEGKKDFMELFKEEVFSYPKPVRLILRLLSIATNKYDLILDFFAGSCTTAHSVLELNKKDGGNRKFIMVQLPEPCDEKSEAYKAGYKTIADIGKERIRRVIKQIKKEKETKNRDNLFKSKEQKDNKQLDLGFKVFKLDSSNIKPWEAGFDNLDESLFDAVENIKPERSETDVLYELLLKYGLDLTVPIERRNICDKPVHIIGAGALIVCLADKVSLDVVEGIARLKDELRPELIRVVFKDAGFKDDVVKTNTVQILRQHGIEDVKSI